MTVKRIANLLTYNSIRVVVGTGLILLVPLIAMMFTDEVNWTVTDFILMGALLISAGLLFTFVAGRVSARYRAVIAAVFIAVVLLIWAELAVGVFGSPFAGE